MYDFKNHMNHMSLRTISKIGLVLTAHAYYAGHLCCSWGFCDWVFFVVQIATSDIHYWCVWCGCKTVDLQVLEARGMMSYTLFYKICITVSAPRYYADFHKYKQIDLD